LSLIDYNLQDRMLNRTLDSAAMTTKEIIEADLREWLGASEKRQMMVTGLEYYNNIQDIRNKKRLAPGEDGKQIEVKNIPNNRILDNVYAELVDLKVNYTFGKSFITDYASQNEADKTTEENLQRYMTANMHILLKDTGVDFLNGGVSYWLPYYKDGFTLDFRQLKSYEVIPYYADERRTVLEMAVRHFQQISYEGINPRVVDKVEVYFPDRIEYYDYTNGALVPDVSRGISGQYMAINGAGYNWGQVPIIPFKYNQTEKPLISKIKSLQDAINRLQSDFMDNMQEDGRNTVLVLKNYGGADLGEFRYNMAVYGAIKVNSSEGVSGGVDTLRVEVNAGNYETILRILKRTLTKNGRGFDALDDQVGSRSPNQMNIQSMYSYIDLDADGIELEFQSSFAKALEYIAVDMRLKGLGELDPERVKVTLNRNMMFNEAELIDSLVKSEGLLSKRTLLANHPMVNDVQEELDTIEQEMKEEIARGEYGFNDKSLEDGNTE